MKEFRATILSVQADHAMNDDDVVSAKKQMWFRQRKRGGLSAKKKMWFRKKFGKSDICDGVEAS
jgi:hypothetical protein